jgi:uncharacterized protein
MRLFIVLVAFLAAGYLLVCAFMWYAQARYLYFPPQRVDPYTSEIFQSQSVTTRTGRQLTFFAAAPRNTMPVVVFFHGNNSDAALQTPLLSEFTALGFGAVSAEYPGYGGNQDRSTEASLLAAARLQVAWAAERWPSSRMVLWGESLGTGVAVAMAAEGHGDGLILDAPYTSISGLAKLRFPWLPVDLLLNSRFDSLSRMRNITVPVLVMHGGQDRVIPVTDGKLIAGAAPCLAAGVFVSEAWHTAYGTDPSHRAKRAVMAFLETVAAGHRPACMSENDKRHLVARERSPGD